MGGARLRTLVTLKNVVKASKKMIKMVKCWSQQLLKDSGGGLVWIKYPKKDMAVTLSYPPLEY